MIRSLNGAGKVDECVDVAVVGAGIAGLFLADKLTRAGLRVALIEAGPAEPTGDCRGIAEAQFVRSTLGSAQEGRSSGLGGTSQLWGGALIPMMNEDFSADTPGWDVHWPIGPDAIKPYVAELEARFGLPGAL